MLHSQTVRRAAGTLCAEDPDVAIQQLLLNALRTISRTRRLLRVNQQALPAKDELAYFAPYLRALERLEGRNRHDRSGLEAVAAFTEIWDRQHHRASAAGPLSFSPAEIEHMSGLLAKYLEWLAEQFPETTFQSPVLN